jgi:hypothetical protein
MLCSLIPRGINAQLTQVYRMRETVQVEGQRRSTSSGTGRPEEGDGKRPMHFEVSGEIGVLRVPIHGLY